LDPQADRSKLPLRQGRAIGWITEALEPLRGQLTDDGLHHLVLAIRSAIGIEALVWLTDIGGLSRHDATALMRQSAQALLQAALSEDATDGA
ncbi:MAG: TetR/AcrR family transcriptional regulator, partial [Nocardioides sp.]